MLPDTLPQRGIPQQADYVALNVERHDGEPTIYSTMGGKAPIYCNVLHAEPQPEIPPGDGGDDLYLLGERFQMDYVVTRAIEAIGDTGWPLIFTGCVISAKGSERSNESVKG